MHKDRPLAGGPALERGVEVKTQIPIAVFQDLVWAVRYGLTTVAEYCYDLAEGGYSLWECEYWLAPNLRIWGSPNWAARYGEPQYLSQDGIAVEALPPRASLAGEVKLLEPMDSQEILRLLKRAALEQAHNNISRCARLGV
jgi:hypothetical protein